MVPNVFWGRKNRCEHKKCPVRPTTVPGWCILVAVFRSDWRRLPCFSRHRLSIYIVLPVFDQQQRLVGGYWCCVQIWLKTPSICFLRHRIYMNNHPLIGGWCTWLEWARAHRWMANGVTRWANVNHTRHTGRKKYQERLHFHPSTGINLAWTCLDRHQKATR